MDFPRGIACKARCEEDVELLIRLIQHNVKLAPTSAKFIKATRNGGILAACFCLASGALFLGFGIRESLTLIALLGGCFLVFGIVTLIRVLRLTSQLPKDDDV